MDNKDKELEEEDEEAKRAVVPPDLARSFFDLKSRRSPLWLSGHVDLEDDGRPLPLWFHGPGAREGRSLVAISPSMAHKLLVSSINGVIGRVLFLQIRRTPSECLFLIAGVSRQEPLGVSSGDRHGKHPFGHVASKVSSIDTCPAYVFIRNHVVIYNL
ncbi:hypothetical protein BRADI_1g60882v3 [Brachypodium distachyon]|uniref:Uncharacterized protein n=1 Tax=Brachypodium distachyon TaxID=15368 RepID=A0A2K2DSQ3_BRADI|nr:hypothetical protein BRADI_1g60882v3 [Brachypodium distachyon]